jgi:uncharacterized protein
MRHRWLVFAALLTGCGRTEEPPSPQAPRSVAIPSAEPAAEPATAPSRAPAPGPGCLVPLPDAPPPEARPAEHCPKDPLAAPPLLPLGSIAFPGAPARPVLRVELALDAPSRTRGLMFRTRLSEESGMLFSWPREEPRSFWMHNTCIPLDMLFLAADGTILGILEQVPTLNDASRSVACPAAHVLEVTAGWARRHGVRPGQKVDVEKPPKEPSP